jgi:ATP-dependent protease ClpP protease subunit
MPDQYRFWGHTKPQRRDEFFNLAVPRSSSDETTATIRMYGPIDSWGGIWGVSAEEVSAALDSLPESVTNIQLRINSPGGDGFEGLAILNMLRAHPATVTAVVDGLAASAASFIAAGCDETVMSPGTQMMIHDAWGLCIGNAADMSKAKSFLDTVSDSIADLYVEAGGGYRAKWRAMMTAETWFTAKEAVSAGLAGRVGVVPDVGVTTTAGAEAEPTPESGGTEGEPQDKFDMTMFRYAGRNQAPQPDLTVVDLPTVAAPSEPAPETDEAPDEPSADPAAEEAAALAQAEAAAESAEESAADDAELAEKAQNSLNAHRAAMAQFTA